MKSFSKLNTLLKSVNTLESLLENVLLCDFTADYYFMATHPAMLSHNLID